MVWFYTSILLMLLNLTFGFPRGKVTEKPETPPIPNPMPPKHRKPPTHISEFTDPDTGLNPFLDIEEGPTAIGRNVMEDERRDDAPYFDIDLVEGDVPNRRWGFQEPKEPLSREPERWPAVDYKDDIDLPIITTPFAFPNPPTTVEIFITKSIDPIKIQHDKLDEEIHHKVINTEKEPFVVSQNTVIYASGTIAAVATIALLVGVCWWRRKLRTPQSRVRVESSEMKS